LATGELDSQTYTARLNLNDEGFQLRKFHYGAISSVIFHHGGSVFSSWRLSSFETNYHGELKLELHEARTQAADST